MTRRGAAAQARVAVVTLLGVALLAGCSHDASGKTTSAGDGTVTVYAAASLVDAFDAVATAYEAANPDVDVRPIVFDGSQVLATQIHQGAPADVFASADERTAQGIAEDLAGAPQAFATNVLEIAVPPSDPADVHSLEDLARDDVTTVLCAPEVPCGHASHELLDASGVTVRPASEEQNVKAVLAKVAAGEADAGLVYTTDVTAAGSTVTGIAVPGARQAANTYVIAPVRTAPDADAARSFTAFVLSPAGQKILAGYGFQPPPGGVDGRKTVSSAAS